MPYTHTNRWVVITDGSGQVSDHATEQDAIDAAEAMLVSPYHEVFTAHVFPATRITYTEE